MGHLTVQHRQTDRAERVTLREDLEGSWDALMRYADAHPLHPQHLEIGEQLVHHLQVHWANELAVLRRRQLRAVNHH